MTNYEKIKAMTLDEMARFFCEGEFGCEGCAGNFDKGICTSEHRRIKAWLKSKAEERTT